MWVKKVEDSRPLRCRRNGPETDVFQLNSSSLYIGVVCALFRVVVVVLVVVVVRRRGLSSLIVMRCPSSVASSISIKIVRCPFSRSPPLAIQTNLGHRGPSVRLPFVRRRGSTACWLADWSTQYVLSIVPDLPCLGSARLGRPTGDFFSSSEEACGSFLWMKWNQACDGSLSGGGGSGKQEKRRECEGYRLMRDFVLPSQ